MNWIETGQGLPKPYVDVLVVDDFDGEPGVCMAYMDRSERWFLSDSLTPQIGTPSHWMQLPALPGQEEA